jgi:hypothetical protein
VTIGSQSTQSAHGMNIESDGRSVEKVELPILDRRCSPHSAA